MNDFPVEEQELVFENREMCLREIETIEYVDIPLGYVRDMPERCSSYVL